MIFVVVGQWANANTQRGGERRAGESDAGEKATGEMSELGDRSRESAREETEAHTARARASRATGETTRGSEDIWGMSDRIERTPRTERANLG